MTIASGVEPIIVAAAQADDAEQWRMATAISREYGLPGLSAVYIGLQDAFRSGRVEGIGDIAGVDGLFDNLKKFAKKVGNGIKSAAKKAAPIAAPFLSLIPGIGPALGAGASALALPAGTSPQQAQAIWQAQQAAAAQKIRTFAGWVGTGQVNPAELAKVKEKNAALAARLAERAKNSKGKILGMHPGVLIALAGLGVFVIARKR